MFALTNIALVSIFAPHEYPTPVVASWAARRWLCCCARIRAAFWTQMEAELRAAGHELNFSQYITLKHLADGSASVTDLAGRRPVNPGAMTRCWTSSSSAASSPASPTRTIAARCASTSPSRRCDLERHQPLRPGRARTRNPRHERCG
jgi:hypothetical protein